MFTEMVNRPPFTTAPGKKIIRILLVFAAAVPLVEEIAIVVFFLFEMCCSMYLTYFFAGLGLRHCSFICFARFCVHLTT